MSHHQPILSPAGTPLAERTVGELVAERPGRSRIFQSFGIDFCCQGGRTLEEACAKKGVALPSVIEQIEAELSANKASAENPADLPLHDLADYIVRVHHDLLRRELPRLHQMAERVAQVHGGHTPELVEVFSIFCGLEAEMFSHIGKEEQVLFPMIRAISRGEAPPMPLDGPIGCMMQEHEDAGNTFTRIRELTSDFQPPVHACNTYRALFAGLQEAEEDLHRHVHLENSVLFPGVQRLAENAQP